MIITIDGPASSGKGTLAKALAEKLNFIYLDTGAMYRTLTLYCLENDIDVYNEGAVEAALSAIEITFDNKRDIYLNGRNVTSAIRTDEISQLTSNPVSVYEVVRAGVVEKERAFAKGENIIVDGRDSGTVVFPQAEIKLFISASLPERARRRYEQNISLGMDTDYQEILNDLAKRDRNDIMRSISPLQLAEDSIVIDTTNMSADEALTYVYEYIIKNK